MSIGNVITSISKSSKVFVITFYKSGCLPYLYKTRKKLMRNQKRRIKKMKSLKSTMNKK